MKRRDNLLAEINSIFEKHGVEYHFYFEDFENEMSIESGINKKFPFASCFKIGVIGAYLEGLANLDELDEEVKMDEGDQQPGTGAYNLLKFPQRVSKLNLLKSIIAFSDGTACDLMIKETGMEKVQEYIARFCHSSRLTNTHGDLLKICLQKYSEAVSLHPDTAWFILFKDILEKDIIPYNYTNAKDLVALLKGFYNYQGADSVLDKIKYGILSTKRAFPRTEIYFPYNVRLLGKTGLIGMVNMNDCGFIEVNGKISCVFGLTTMGWRLPYQLCNSIFAEVGTYILKYLGITEFQFYNKTEINLA